MRGACARVLFGQGVSRGAPRIISILGNAAALEAALAWYRSNKGLSGDFGTITVPTLYIWGDSDATVGPDAAHGTAAGPVGAAYAMAVLPGVGHFVMDQAAAPGHRADAHPYRRSIRLGVGVALPLRSICATTRAVHEIWRFSHGSQEDRADRRRTDRRHARPAGRPEGTRRRRAVRHRRRRARQGKALDLAQLGPVEGFDASYHRARSTTRTSPAPTSSSSPRACRASPA